MKPIVAVAPLSIAPMAAGQVPAGPKRSAMVKRDSAVQPGAPTKSGEAASSTQATVQGARGEAEKLTGIPESVRKYSKGD